MLGDSEADSEALGLKLGDSEGDSDPIYLVPLIVNPRSASVESAGSGASMVKISPMANDTSDEKVADPDVCPVPNSTVPIGLPFLLSVKLAVALQATLDINCEFVKFCGNLNAMAAGCLMMISALSGDPS